MILVVDSTQPIQWLTETQKNEFLDEDFVRILNFYLFNTPCTELSAKGKTFAEYGWEAPEKSPWKLTMHIESFLPKNKNICCCESFEKFSKKLIVKDWIHNFMRDETFDETAVFIEKRKQIVAYSLLYHIRNAFAHGRFYSVTKTNEVYFIFEDVSKVTVKKNRYGELSYTGTESVGFNQNSDISNLRIVTARMILRKVTLLKWIDLIEGGQIKYIPQKNRKVSRLVSIGR